MGLAQTLPRISEAEYLEIDRAAAFKSEFFDGEMFAMAGGTPQHSQISQNIGARLHAELSDRSCVVYNSDLRIKVEATGLCTYPDVSVVCGPMQFAIDTEDTATNPVLLVEVLSDTTEAYDRGRKFENYRQIPSLREYLMVSQKEPKIDHFVRQDDGRWLLNAVAGLDASLNLASLGISLPLREVFSKVKFVPSRIREATPPPLC